MTNTEFYQQLVIESVRAVAGLTPTPTFPGMPVQPINSDPVALATKAVEIANAAYDAAQVKLSQISAPTT